MDLFHLTLAVRGRRAIADGESQRRRIVRSLVRVGGPRVVLFCLVDDHVHAVLRVPSPAGFAADGLRRVLRAARPDLALKRTYLEPVTTRPHLRSLVSYLLGQPRHHGLGVHPALWSGSCFPDLIGARCLADFSARSLRDELPRLRRRDLFAAVELPPEPLEPASNELLARAGCVRLVDLASKVLAVDPALLGRTRPVLAARELALAACAAGGLPVSGLEARLGVGVRSMQRLTRKLSSHPVPPALAALRLRLALELRVTEVLGAGQLENRSNGPRLPNRAT